eukprot:360145-Chlamydomonas_euryale.AAC.2
MDGYKIYMSTDSGSTWSQLAGSNILSYSAVAMSSDGTVIVAATKNGYIYYSSDSGLSWGPLTAGGSRTWTDVAISSSGTVISAGASTSVYTSTDSGASWSSKSIGANVLGIAMKGTGDVIFATRRAGLYRSVNSGTSFTEITNTDYNSDVDVSYDGDDIALTRDYRSDEFEFSTNGGLTFTRLSLGKRMGPVAISADGTHVTMAVLNGGQLWSTTNMGSVTPTARGPSLNWQSIDMSEDGSIQTAVASCACNDSGGIYVSTDSGATWMKTL